MEVIARKDDSICANIRTKIPQSKIAHIRKGQFDSFRSVVEIIIAPVILGLQLKNVVD